MHHFDQLILTKGKLLLTPNHCYMGVNKIDLTKDTIYTHPNEKVCSYQYTHPTEKQCNYSVDLSGYVRNTDLTKIEIGSVYKQSGSTSNNHSYYDFTIMAGFEIKAAIVCPLSNYYSESSNTFHNATLIYPGDKVAYTGERGTQYISVNISGSTLTVNNVYDSNTLRYVAFG